MVSKRARVLLIAPNIKGTADGINRVQPGLGIGYLAAVLREAGHDVHVRDTALEGYHIQKKIDGQTILIGENDKAIASYISNLSPDIVGISAIFSNLMEHAHTIARIVKEINPRILVVLGGNHISCAARDYQYSLDHPDESLSGVLEDMQDENIDFAMAGEVEFQFLELVNRLTQGRDPSNIPGLVYRRGERMQVNNPPANLKDLDILPVPARDLMNMEGYFNIGFFHSSKSVSKRVLNVMTSRGCPETCSFCSTPLIWGNRVRCRDPKNIYEEIKAAKEMFRIGEVQFEDDTLTANRANLLQLCDLIKPLNVSWCTPNGIRLDYHQKSNRQYELFKRMADSGCYQVSFGCESGVQRVLNDVMNKNLKLELIKPSIENAKKAGLVVHTFWIVGIPGETRKEMEATIEFAAQVGADSYTVSIFSPLLGTSIYHEVLKKDLWWEGKRGVKDMLYRNSLIKVDGFDNAKEFERWVDEKNLYLNSLLKKRDPERFYKKYKDDSGTRYLLKQT